MENQISLSLTDAQWQEAETAVQALKKLFDGRLISLTPKQRQSIAKMGDGSVPFVEKAVDYARRNPEFLPPFVKVEEFETDLKAARMLNGLYQLLSQLVVQIDDSMMVSGHEAFSAARSYYATVKMATKVNTPGAKVIEADLAERFAGQGRTTPPDDQPPA